MDNNRFMSPHSMDLVMVISVWQCFLKEGLLFNVLSDVHKHLHALVVTCIHTRVYDCAYLVQNVFDLLSLHQLWVVMNPLLRHHNNSACIRDVKQLL